MNKDRSGLLILALILAGALYYCERSTRIPPELTAAEGFRRGYLGLDVSASRIPNKVRVRIRRSGHGAAQVTIPAGTRYIASNASYQDVMTARTIVIPLPSDDNEQVVEIEVYCLNRFRSVPGEGLDYIVEPNEPSGPTAQLAQCLEQKHGDADHDTRQMAIWLVQEDLLGKTREQAAEVFRENLGDEANARLEQALHDVEADLRSQQFSEQEIADGIAAYRAERLPKVLDEVVADELAKDWSRARTLLADCGVDVDQAPFFR